VLTDQLKSAKPAHLVLARACGRRPDSLDRAFKALADEIVCLMSPAARSIPSAAYYRDFTQNHRRRRSWISLPRACQKRNTSNLSTMAGPDPGPIQAATRRRGEIDGDSCFTVSARRRSLQALSPFWVRYFFATALEHLGRR